MESDIPKKSSLRGKNLSEIPCFRNSYLYGITSGIAVGLIHFMCTSRVKLSSHFGVSVFAVTTLSYWTYCRYKWTKDEKAVEVMKEYLRHHVSKEGTLDEKLPIHSVSDVKTA